MSGTLLSILLKHIKSLNPGNSLIKTLRYREAVKVTRWDFWSRVRIIKLGAAPATSTAKEWPSLCVAWSLLILFIYILTVVPIPFILWILTLFHIKHFLCIKWQGYKGELPAFETKIYYWRWNVSHVTGYNICEFRGGIVRLGWRLIMCSGWVISHLSKEPGLYQQAHKSCWNCVYAPDDQSWRHTTQTSDTEQVITKGCSERRSWQRWLKGGFSQHTSW